MKNKEVIFKRFSDILIPFIAILASLLLAALVLWLVGYDPVKAFFSLAKGAFGDSRKIANTLLEATPLIFTGLAVAFAFRCGLFNIGVEGQLLVASVAAAYTGFKFTNLPMIIHLPLSILAAMFVGGLWASIPGVLKAKLGVHEVINTIMMNYIAYALVAYLGTKVLIEPPGAIPQTPEILPSSHLVQIREFFNINSRLNIGFLLALLAGFLVYYILWRTVLGYEIRAVGLNPHAAEYSGISVTRNIIMAMIISGMLAGLAGAERVLGLHFRYIQGFSPGYGFIGIAVALLGRNTPLGVIMAALLFGALDSGGAYMARVTKIPNEIVGIVQAVIIFFVASDYAFRKRLELLNGRKVVKGDV